MNRREQGRKAVETMLRYGMPTIEVEGDWSSYHRAYLRCDHCGAVKAKNLR